MDATPIERYGDPDAAVADAAADPPLAFRTQREEVDDVAVAVDGEVPGWLRGTFLLNGPGRFEVGGRPVRHWFDALALVRRLRIDGDAGGDATVRYATRYVRSDDYRWARWRGRVRTGTVGTPADRSPLGRLRGALAGRFPDNPAIGFARVAGETYAVTESPVGVRIDPDSLATTGRLDLAAGLDVDVTLGHVHADHDRREHVGLGVSYGRDRGYTIYRRPFGSTVPTAVGYLPFDDVPYVHTFGLTERFAVVPDYPFGIDTTALLVGAPLGRTFLDAFESRPGPTRFHVVDRRSGERVATPAAGPTFCYHVANAYEADGAIVVDAVTYPDERAVTGLTVAALRAAAAGTDTRADLPAGDLVRYRLPLESDDPTAGDWATRETLRAGPMEFPTIHYRRSNGRPYRYVYLAEFDAGVLPTRLVKFDVEDGSTASWDAATVAAGAAAHPSEGTFVPHPAPDAEDDGVLLTVVLDPEGERTVLVVLDARGMTELARAPLPGWTPYPFHGQFVDARDPARTMQ
jgi:carotenoid cleavage dioxygenase-like enzyme